MRAAVLRATNERSLFSACGGGSTVFPFAAFTSQSTELFNSLSLKDRLLEIRMGAESHGYGKPAKTSGEVVGVGLVFPERGFVHLLSRQQDIVSFGSGESFWREKLLAALRWKQQLLRLPTASNDSYRWLNGLGDGTPGITADVFDSTEVVVQSENETATEFVLPHVTRAADAEGWDCHVVGPDGSPVRSSNVPFSSFASKSRRKKDIFGATEAALRGEGAYVGSSEPARESLEAAIDDVDGEGRANAGGEEGSGGEPILPLIPFSANGIRYDCGHGHIHLEARTLRDVWADTVRKVVGKQDPTYRNQPQVLDICGDCGICSAIALEEGATVVTAVPTQTHVDFIEGFSWAQEAMGKTVQSVQAADSQVVTRPRWVIRSPALDVVRSQPPRYFPVVSVQVGDVCHTSQWSALGRDGQNKDPANRILSDESQAEMLVREAVARVANRGVLFIQCHGTVGCENILKRLHCAFSSARRSVTVIKRIGPSGDFTFCPHSATQNSHSLFQGLLCVVN